LVDQGERNILIQFPPPGPLTLISSITLRKTRLASFDQCLSLCIKISACYFYVTKPAFFKPFTGTYNGKRDHFILNAFKNEILNSAATPFCTLKTFGARIPPALPPTVANGEGTGLIGMLIFWVFLPSEAVTTASTQLGQFTIKGIPAPFFSSYTRAIYCHRIFFITAATIHT
jgi:hypothetical protein